MKQTPKSNNKSRSRKILREMLDWFFWVFLRKIIIILPKKVTYFIASALGRSLKPVQRSYLKITHDKYSKTLNEHAGSFPFGEIITNGIINYIKKEIEVIYHPEMAKNVERWISIEGRDHLDNALKKGRGVILLHLHFGAIHVPILTLGHLGYNITQLGVNPLYLPDKGKERMSYFARKAWEMKSYYEKILPADFIYVGTSLKKVFTCLKNNGIIDMAADGREGTRDVSSSFVGQDTSFSLGPFRIAKRSGAVILPTFIIRKGDNTHRLVIESPITPDGLETEDMFRSFIKKAEEYVYMYPCHYIRMLKTLCMENRPS